MVYCSKCGRQVETDARFCSACGAGISAGEYRVRRPLQRPRDGRMIAGVCAAIANEYGMDVSLVRLVAVLCLFFSIGMMALAYIVAWIIIPETPYLLPDSTNGTIVS